MELNEKLEEKLKKIFEAMNLMESLDAHFKVYDLDRYKGVFMVDLIRRGGEIDYQEFIKKAGMDEKSASYFTEKIITPLQEKGYITTERNPENQRTKKAVITKTGKELAEKVIEGL